MALVNRALDSKSYNLGEGVMHLQHTQTHTHTPDPGHSLEFNSQTSTQFVLQNDLLFRARERCFCFWLLILSFASLFDGKHLHWKRKHNKETLLDPMQMPYSPCNRLTRQAAGGSDRGEHLMGKILWQQWPVSLRPLPDSETTLGAWNPIAY